MLEIAPNNFEALTLAALEYIKIDDNVAAFQLLGNALSINPKYEPVRDINRRYSQLAH
jgi:Tfp pilus assembly protein PilF